MKCNQRAATLTAAILVVVVLGAIPGSHIMAQTTFKTLHKFGTTKNDGLASAASLVFDQSGNLYGTTVTGGDLNCGCGVVFRLTQQTDGSWKESLLHIFKDLSPGGGPTANVIFDKVGNLYGTTASGGPSHYGTVFKLSPNADGTWNESVIYAFNGQHDGGAPQAGLIFDQAGNLYGTTFLSGNSNGTVFQLTPNTNGGWAHSVLYAFGPGKTGFGPHAGVIFDQAGNLYGTAEFGGSGGGVVFRLTKGSNGKWTETVLHSFTGGKDGGAPQGGVIFDQAGNLYGTTFGGGAGKNGVVFRLTATAGGGWKAEPLHQFTLEGRKDGGQPVAGLIFDSAGNLYGTATRGGAYGFGVVFKLANGGWKETLLHSFKNNPGSVPSAALISDSAGNLYGTSLGDGESTAGSVFEDTP